MDCGFETDICGPGRSSIVVTAAGNFAPSERMAYSGANSESDAIQIPVAGVHPRGWLWTAGVFPERASD